MRVSIHAPIGRSVGRASLLALAPALVLATACGSSDPGASSDAPIEAPASAFPDNQATGTPVKIGLINPEGGPAISQPTNREAAEAVVAYANANLGGLAGHPIELVSCANKEDPASARDCANQMVESRVAAVVVPITGQSESIVPIITGAGIPYVSPTGSSRVDLTTPGAFMLTGGFPATLGSMAEHAKDNGYTKVTAFVTDNSSVVPATKGIGGPAFQAAGVELQVVPIPLGTPDATPQVSSGLSADVGGVAIVGDATVCTTILKSLQTLGATQDKLLVQPCLDPSTVQAVGDAMDGAHIFTGADLTSGNDEAVLYRSVMQKYAPDTDIAGYTSSGYQAMLGFVRAAQGVTGEPTASSILAAIKAARDIPLPAGDGITFTCDGTAVPSFPTVCSAETLTATIQNGELTNPRVVE
ncbi:ABC transporter substrate-binding protein [Rhodococcus opacus]|uniref:ABC transporter substrate-binding protein n=1 Tax=Rhodococcus opacus TaxID=37919 RepID=UPI001C45C20B|nr:ABC transporter substrate-binding protein [Rhodococcus opacus]MBV6756210.1 ABC transporter substrate-binding protein [Rhodococcus opacus]